MYKINSDLAQRRARQLWLADLQGQAFNDLSPEEQRANLVRARVNINNKIVTLPKNSDERRALGKLVSELDARIHAIRPKLKGPKGTASHFIEVCRERLSPFMFRTFMHEASVRAEAKEGAE